LAEPSLCSRRSPLAGGSRLVLTSIVALAFVGCGGGSGSSKAPANRSTSPTRSTLGTIVLRSAAFEPGGAIPVRYTCDGAGVSPPLQWLNLPPRTVELFLLAIDLDGGRTDAVQWAVGGLIPSLRGISSARLPPGAVVGRSSPGRAGWDGICGARGRVHHVAFLLYALNRKLGLKPGFDPALVRGGLSGGTLARGLTLATYKRR
jgi:phosphatidylethanolamine-binding protein (PEBP) family uncharacterized protein